MSPGEPGPGERQARALTRTLLLIALVVAVVGSLGAPLITSVATAGLLVLLLILGETSLWRQRLPLAVGLALLAIVLLAGWVTRERALTSPWSTCACCATPPSRARTPPCSWPGPACTCC